MSHQVRLQNGERFDTVTTTITTTPSGRTFIIKTDKREWDRAVKVIGGVVCGVWFDGHRVDLTQTICHNGEVINYYDNI